MSPRISLPLFILAIFMTIVTGCTRIENDSDGITTPGTGVVLGDNAVSVEQSPYSLIGSIDSTYTISSSTQIGIVAGDILIGENDGGFIRRVVSIVVDSTLAICETEAATLVEAITRGSCRDTMLVPLGDIPGSSSSGQWLASEVNYQAAGVSATAEGLEFTNITIVDETYGPAQVTATISEGSLTFSPELAFQVGIDVRRMKEYIATAAGDLTFLADVTFSSTDSVTCSSEAVLLYSVTHSFSRTLGPVPVVTDVTLDIYAGVKAALTTAADISLTQSHIDALLAGTRYLSPAWRTQWEAETDAGGGAVFWDNHQNGTIHCFIEPRVTMSHYGLAGPILRPQAWIGMNAENDGFWWNYDALTGYDYAIEWGDESCAVPGFDLLVAPLDTLGFVNQDTVITASDLLRVGGLIFSSTPGGASLILDGVPAGIVTPDTLDYIDQGLHEVRYYIDGYNEYFETIEYTGGLQNYSATLTTPSWPRPVFTITAPVDSAVFGDNVITITGRVDVGDGVGGTTAYTGATVTMRMNGIDQIVAVSGGEFALETGILSGWNEMRMRATGDNGQTGTSEPANLLGDYVPDEIVIQLSWDSPASDMDMHIWSPSGEHCYFGNQIISEGSLDIDDVNGYGPETFTVTEALDGQYTLKINAYSMHGDAASANSVTIWLNGGVPTTFGPYTLSVSDSNGSNPAAWWTVDVFTMADGQRTLAVKPATPEQIAKIDYDMAHLPVK